MFQPLQTRARQIRLPVKMPRPVSLPPPGFVRVWMVTSTNPRAVPARLGLFPGRHPGAVVAGLPFTAIAFIVLTPSGRHTAWTQSGPARSEAA